jgi:drug/metabolite transporter (DMT)-like permease
MTQESSRSQVSVVLLVAGMALLLLGPAFLHGLPKGFVVGAGVLAALAGVFCWRQETGSGRGPKHPR